MKEREINDQPEPDQIAVEIVSEDSEPEKTRPKVVIPSDAVSDAIRPLRKKRDIRVMLSNTMMEIMQIYASKRDKIKSKRFQNEACKYLLEGLDQNKNHILFTKFLSNVGDIHVKYGGKANLDTAYKNYEEANKILDTIMGKESFDFIMSMTDIGDVYLERKSYNEAEAFYIHCK